MSNPVYNAKGEDYLYAADLDPTVTAVDAKRGTILIVTGTTPGLFQKQDSGLSTNWLAVGGGGGGMNTDFSNAVASTVDLDLGNNQINNLADPSLAQDAATKNYVDTEIAGLPVSMATDFSNATAAANDLDLGNNQINNLADPTLAQDAATKNYVDTEIAGLPVSMATDFSNATAAANDLDLGNNQINNLADPTLAQDAATKNYVDSVIPAPGMATDFSNAVAAAASINLNNNNLTNINTLSGTGTNTFLISQPYNASSAPLDITTGDGPFPAALRITTGSTGTQRADLRFQTGPVSFRAVGFTTYLEFAALNPTGAGGVALAAPNGNMQLSSSAAISLTAGAASNILFPGFANLERANAGAISFWGANIPGLVLDGTSAQALAAGASAIILNAAPATCDLLMITSEANSASRTNNIQIFTGKNLGAGSSGDVFLYSGETDGAGSTGQIFIESSRANGGGSTGQVRLRTGESSGLTGNITLETGNSSAGNSGDIGLGTGTAAGTRGRINMSAREYLFQDMARLVRDFAPFNFFWGAPMPTLVLDGRSSEAVTAGAFAIALDSNPNTVQVLFGTIDQNSANPSSRMDFLTGSNTGAGESGGIGITSGDSDNANSGILEIKTGFGGVDSGSATLRTGNAVNNTGFTSVRTGDAATGLSGDIRLEVGSAPAGNRGKARMFNQTQFVLGQFAADPANAENGEIWYNTTTNELKAFVNGVVVVIA